MCCQSCKNISLSFYVKSYSFLCIGMGILFAVWSVWASRQSFERLESLSRASMFNLVYITLTFFAALSYALAGFLMLVGTIMGTMFPFVCGKALSYIFPFVSFMFILPLVIHFLYVTKLCDYIKERWPEPAKN